MNPRYPVYIVSKGRWDTRLTSRSLHGMAVPHYVIVEAQERDAYAETLDATATILVLDPAYQRDYETCDDVGDGKSKGPGPARNFAWAHSLSLGARRHWVMDDNIRGFFRLDRNHRTRLMDGTGFAVMEDFVDRYVNVAMAGPQYYGFTTRKQRHPPFIANTRIYSCNLIFNEAPFRWRGRYNEDTILSLDMLKAGWCTVLFFAVIQNKVVTQSMKGGNTAEFYAREGTMPKSEMLVRIHPDVTRLMQRYGRAHHFADYRSFGVNRLRKVPGLVIPEGVNDYGMRFEVKRDGEWVTEQ